MKLYVHHDGQQLGPYSLEDVLSQLSAGTIQPTDLAWHEGALEWQPLASIPAIARNAPPPLAAAAALPAAAPSNTQGLAIASLVLGILSLLTAGLTAIPAVICGHVSRANIRKSAGTQTGDGLALVGLILGYVGVAIIGVAVLAGLAVPVILNQQKKGDLSEASSNVRSLGCALFNFEQDYGIYPSDAAAVEVLKNNPDTDIPFGKATSNDYFRQLIAAGYIDTERSFYAHIAGCHKSDNNIGGGHCLEKGECGYSYVIGVQSNAYPAQPLMLTPLIPGTARFDPQPFGGRAVILWTDCSVTTERIDNSGHVLRQGTNLLDPAHPVWQDKPPRIVWPE